MTPNESTISKLKLNNDSISDTINELRKLVIEEKRCISYSYTSLRFGLHVSQAIKILDQFVAEERNNGNNLCVNYLLFGNNDNTDNDNEIKMERFMIVKELDIESETNWFKNGFNKQIYSVAIDDDNDSIDLNFDEFDYEVKNKQDLNDLQNLTYVKNPNIEFRTNLRRRGIKPSIVVEEDKSEPTKSTSNVKNESESKPKPKTTARGRNAKNRKISNIFSKNKKEVKEEIEDIECEDNKESEDPFRSDSEEEKETKTEVKDEIEVIDDSMDEKSTKKEKDSKESCLTNGKKRHSKSDLISSEDEVIVSKKKRSKKYKRIRIQSDSDSDDSKEETPIEKFVGTKKDNSKSKPITKRLEERLETHFDSEGYLVTKKVKKEVELNNGFDSKSILIEKTAKDIEEKTKAIEEKTKAIDKNTKVIEKKTKGIEEKTKAIDKNTKVIEKKTKVIEKKTKAIEEKTKVIEDETQEIEEKNESKEEIEGKEEKEGKERPKSKANKKVLTKKIQKPTKDTKSKTQSSITSFFKPKPVST